MTKAIVKEERERANERQGGLCFYCERPMWDAHRESKDQAAERFGIVRFTPGSRRLLSDRRLTAEHVIRKADGGKNFGNIVAACKGCNDARGEATPEAHKLAMMCREVQP